MMFEPDVPSSRPGLLIARSGSTSPPSAFTHLYTKIQRALRSQERSHFYLLSGLHCCPNLIFRSAHLRRAGQSRGKFRRAELLFRIWLFPVVKIKRCGCSVRQCSAGLHRAAISMKLQAPCAPVRGNPGDDHPTQKKKKKKNRLLDVICCGRRRWLGEPGMVSI